MPELVIMKVGMYIVAYLLTARIVEPEKQPLLTKALKQHSFLGNGLENKLAE
jgi:hypothetical protein